MHSASSLTICSAIGTTSVSIGAASAAARTSSADRPGGCCTWALAAFATAAAAAAFAAAGEPGVCGLAMPHLWQSCRESKHRSSLQPTQVQYFFPPLPPPLTAAGFTCLASLPRASTFASRRPTNFTTLDTAIKLPAPLLLFSVPPLPLPLALPFDHGMAATRNREKAMRAECHVSLIARRQRGGRDPPTGTGCHSGSP